MSGSFGSLVSMKSRKALIDLEDCHLSILAWYVRFSICNLRASESRSISNS